ncbi:MAG: thiol reductant ABC exporter subunit CydD [Xanthomonadales bacterium]|nr:thiol reductant ABC exporter subunit CydD [Xanthomonadales bacterium]
MAATIERDLKADGDAWLKRQAPGWLVPGMTLISALDAGIVIAQAWLIAALAAGAFIERQPLAALMPMMWLLLLVLVLRALSGGIRQWLAGRASVRVRYEIRAGLLRRFEKTGPANLPPDGESIAAFDEQVEAFDGFYSRFLPQRISATVVPLAILVFAFATDWLAGLLLLLTAPLIPLFMILIGIGAEKLAREQFRSLARLGGWFLDQVRGAATIRLFRAEDQARRQVERRTDALRRETMRVLRLAFLSSAVLEFFSAVAIASLAIYIGLGLLGYLTFGPAPDLTLQSGLFLLLLAPEFFQPLRALSQGWHDRADAAAAAGEVRQLLTLPPARPRAEDGIAPEAPRQCKVELRGVSFAHPDKAPLLRDLDLEIEPGLKIALVGPSGSGKSSLISMLAGFAEPSSGDILLDGQPLARFSDAALRDHVAWLGQRPVLFAGTIAENIALGWESASREQIARAADQGGVGEFADRLPEGLDSPVGENGYGLSGGQAQRVALARALLRPRPLVLLDEPTANLDGASEALVLQALENMLSERSATVICAAHRAATMAWADRILAIEQGNLKWLR